MSKSLAHEDVLFDENCYKDIDTEEKALSFIRYYSKNVATFRMQLSQLGWGYDETNALIDLLWKRVINGCMRFGIPLTKEAEPNAKRLGINY